VVTYDSIIGAPGLPLSRASYFEPPYNITLTNMTTGLIRYWNLHVNATVEGIQYDLTLWNTTIVDGWGLDCSTLPKNSILSVHNSMLNDIYFTSFYSPVFLNNVTLKGSLSVYYSQLYVQGNIHFEEGFNIPWWTNSVLKRSYDILVMDEGRFPVSNASLMLYDENDTLIWTGKTDNSGQSSFNLTFYDNNYTSLATLRVEREGYYDAEKLISLTSSTPFIMSLTPGLMIDGNQTYIIEGVSFIQAGNVIVRDNATLIIKNSSFRSDGMFIEGSATLLVENSSINSQSVDFYESSKVYIISNSVMNGFGVGDDVTVKISNSTIERVTTYGRSKLSIDNSTIKLIFSSGTSKVSICDSSVYYLRIYRWSTVYASGSRITYIRPIFEDSSNTTLYNISGGEYKYWNVYLNCSVIYLGWNLTLIDTKVEYWDLEFSTFNSPCHVSIHNSTFSDVYVYGYKPSFISFHRSTITYRLSLIQFRGSVSLDDAEIGYLGAYATNCYLYGNISFRSAWPVGWGTAYVRRNYNVHAIDAEGSPVSNASMNLYDENQTLIYKGFTDSQGWAFFNITFTDANYTSVTTLKIEKEGYYDVEKNVTMLSDTPIAITMTTIPVQEALFDD